MWVRHPQGTDLLKIEGQCCIPNFPCAVEQKCNINTVSFASGLRLGGWGGIPRVVKQPLKLSSRPQECERSLFPPVAACCGRCSPSARSRIVGGYSSGSECRLLMGSTAGWGGIAHKRRNWEIPGSAQGRNHGCLLSVWPAVRTPQMAWGWREQMGSARKCIML